ncbi:MAG: 3-methyl-2-oxobutanoate dehydrogenase subunit beta [Thermoplasmata archaeon]
MAKLTIPKEEHMNSGHIGCLGCGGTLTMRYLLKALGNRTIVTIPACCMAIMSGVYPRGFLKVPLLDVAFETTAASASGIRAALDAKGIKDISVVGFAGDGGTVDIGIQALSGAAERGDNIIYVMYDNEAYMNTGIQRSGATPFGAWTTTTPVGTTGDFKKRPKKNMMEIMVAHDIPYAATCSVAYPEDFVKKVQKAKDMDGTRFFHVFSPCPTGWRFSPEMTIQIGVLAYQTGVFPMYEVENGVYRITKKPAKRKPVSDYLKVQGRFRHLTDDLIEIIQKNVDRDWEMLLAKQEFTKKFAE